MADDWRVTLTLHDETHAGRAARFVHEHRAEGDLRHRLGHLVAAALMAAIGAALGSLIRSQIAAVIGVFAWTIVIESLLGALFNAVQPYLPYTAATTLAGTQLGGAAFGPAHDASTAATALPFAAAVALLAALALVLALLAGRTTVPRDVS